MNVKLIFAGGHHSWVYTWWKKSFKSKIWKFGWPDFWISKSKLSGLSLNNNLSFDEKIKGEIRVQIL